MPNSMHGGGRGERKPPLLACQQKKDGRKQPSIDGRGRVWRFAEAMRDLKNQAFCRGTDRSKAGAGVLLQEEAAAPRANRCREVLKHASRAAEGEKTQKTCNWQWAGGYFRQ